MKKFQNTFPLHWRKHKFYNMHAAKFRKPTIHARAIVKIYGQIHEAKQTCYLPQMFIWAGHVIFTRTKHHVFKYTIIAKVIKYIKTDQIVMGK